AYQKIIGQPFEVANGRPQKRYVDSSKVEEHYAIIPTKTIPSEQKIAGLPPMERNIYIEIVRNTMAMFHRDYLYEETTILTDVKSIEFKTTGKVELDKGFQGLLPVATIKKEEPL